MMRARQEFMDIYHKRKTLKACGFVGKWTRKEALDTLNERYQKHRAELISLLAQQERETIQGPRFDTTREKKEGTE